MKKITSRQQRTKRRKELIKAIYINSECQRSHMPGTAKKSTQNPEFHARCMEDYAEAILIMCRELHLLALVDYRRVYE